MVKNITIFTTNTCAYCVMVKKWLDNKGHGYEVVNLDTNPERQEEALRLSGALTVPKSLEFVKQIRSCYYASRLVGRLGSEASWRCPARSPCYRRTRCYALEDPQSWRSWLC